MRSGDRDAAAAFLVRFGDRIRSRVRAKLSGRVRRLFDSQDILSTVARRLDRFVLSGQLTAANEPELWALVFRLAEHAVVDKARLLRRLERVEGEDSVFASELRSRLDDEASEEGDGLVAAALESTTDPTDRTILSLWLNDLPHAEIGRSVGLSAEAVRWRWHRIRARLQDRLRERAA
ncbi:MAG: sigma-70 family RNA polymerase sigma factor [Phycisphaerales bacterium]|nr:sigma-70 family RNA polymerase sigma factor [Phycisphaerales bacterium]